MENSGEVLTKNIIQTAYAEGGMMEHWDRKDTEIKKQWSEAVFHLLEQEQILTISPKKDFLFLGVASNQGSKELKIAEMWDTKISSDDKPRFIVTDFFGKHNSEGEFEPGFKKEEKSPLNNILFNYISAEANSLPVTAESADVIFDIRGAIWHTLYKDIWQDIASHSNELDNFKIAPDIQQKIKLELINLLTEYKRVMKPESVIIIDDSSVDTDISTGGLFDLVLGNEFENFLLDNGLDYTELSDENETTGLLLLRKAKET